jgi:phosphocarrier protein
MIQRTLTLINKLGLHARAAARLVETAQAFGSSVVLEFGGARANGKSIMSVLMLAAPVGSVLELSVEGEDEQEAAHAVEDLVSQRFGEPD